MKLLFRQLLIVTTLLMASNVSLGKSLEEVLRQVPDEYSRSRQHLEKLVKKFRTNIAREKQRQVYRLDTHSSELRRISGGQSTAIQITEVADVRSWFTDGGDVPLTLLAVVTIVPYAENLANMRGVVRKPLTALINRLNSNDREKLSLKLERAFDELGGRMSARSVVKPGNNFGGYRSSLNNPDFKRIRLSIRKLQGQEFTGRVERDLGISHHPVHSMTGSFHGMKLVANTGPTAAFGNKLDGNWTYSGYVIGKTILGRCHARTIKGRPKQGYFLVKLR